MCCCCFCCLNACCCHRLALSPDARIPPVSAGVGAEDNEATRKKATPAGGASAAGHVSSDRTRAANKHIETEADARALAWVSGIAERERSRDAVSTGNGRS